MWYILKILIVASFFVLPVNLGPFGVTMYDYLMLGIRSPFPVALYCGLAIASAIYLVFYFRTLLSPLHQVLTFVALLCLGMVVTLLIVKHDQFSTISSQLQYVLFLVLLGINWIGVFRNHIMRT